MTTQIQPVAPVPLPKPTQRERRLALGVGLLLLVCATLLYLWTLDNGFQSGELVGGDLITHQYAQVQARPSNAPGYPLYTIGGWLWFHGLRAAGTLLGNPLPNPIPLLSSYSTLWALLALGLLYLVILRITRSLRHPAGNWRLAFLLGAFYAVTYFFWYYATTTEQYTSAIAQTLAIVYVYLLWQEREHDWLLVLLAFLCGLSLAHMLTVALIVPPLIIAILWQRPRVLRKPGLLFLVVAAGLLPLISYTYVYIRGAAHPEWWGNGEWRSATEWFWAFISTAQGREELSRGFAATCAFFDGGFPELIWQELSIVLLLVGLAGIALLEKHLRFALYGTLVLYLLFDWMYRCGNWFQVILPAYPLILIGAAAAFDRWEDYFRQRKWWLRDAPLALLILLIVWRFTASYDRANSRNQPHDLAFARAGVLLDQPLPANAGIFAPTEDALALDYLINIWGINPTVQLVSSKQAGELLKGGGVVLSTFDAAPVLLSELPPEVQPARSVLSADWLQLSAEPMTEPMTEPLAEPDAYTEVNQPIAPGVTLRGYRVTAAPAGSPATQASPAADITLRWSLENSWPADLGVSIRPMQGGEFIPDPNGAPGAIYQVDRAAPGEGLVPADSPALVTDVIRAPLPANTDAVRLLIYRRSGDHFETLADLTVPAPKYFVP